MGRGRAAGCVHPACAWALKGRTGSGTIPQRQGPQDSRSAPDRTGRRAMKSKVVKRSIVVAGHKTSVSLEEAFWKGLKDIAADRRITLSDLVGAIDSERQHGNLSSAIRLFVLEYYQAGLGSDRPAGRKPRAPTIAHPQGASILR